ncbi:MAG: trypsin-like peptidase domain-containing protein [Burkholderiales bacterium]|nr:trypsin-like peptidase domain-containing protein [Opitutaceae bacterium]
MNKTPRWSGRRWAVLVLSGLLLGVTGGVARAQTTPAAAPVTEASETAAPVAAPTLSLEALGSDQTLPAERAVVQILTSSQTPEYDAPWRFESVRRSTGTGFVIESGRILTNAHVIAWAKQILVRRYQDPRLLPARVVYAGHDCDLALIELEDPKGLDGVQPLEFGELPPVRSTVVTAGYPAGGEQMSFTRGVVSRIEVQPYAHPGNRALLAVQTDAAINPGNSGGPVLQDNKVVGVAFQGIPGLQNAGFFIPPEIVRHFLRDVADGRYDGFPLAGVTFEPLQNPAYRRHLGLPDDGFGARVDGLRADGTAIKVLRPDDVLLEAGGLAVGSDGMVLYRGNRVSAGIAFQQPQSGESLRLKIWRDRAPLELELPVSAHDGDRLAGRQYDTPPRYYIHAGLVFTSLSANYIDTVGRLGRDYVWEGFARMIHELYHLPAENPGAARPEPVVFAGVLPHPVNADLGVRGRMLVNRINGVRIERLEDVKRAFAENKNARDVIEFEGPDDGPIEAIDHAAAAAAHAAILRTYGIVSDQRL